MTPVTGHALLVYAIVAVFVLVILIARFKLNPFITLIVVSLALGAAIGMPMSTIVKSATSLWSWASARCSAR